MTAVPDVHQPPFRRAVLAVNGGSSDARIVRLACQAAKLSKAQLVAVHVVEIDWSLPLEADVASRSEDAQRVLDAVEGIANRNTRTSRRSCSRPGTWVPHSSMRRANGPPTC